MIKPKPPPVRCGCFWGQRVLAPKTKDKSSPCEARPTSEKGGVALPPFDLPALLLFWINFDRAWVLNRLTLVVLPNVSFEFLHKRTGRPIRINHKKNTRLSGVFLFIRGNRRLQIQNIRYHAAGHFLKSKPGQPVFEISLRPSGHTPHLPSSCHEWFRSHHNNDQRRRRSGGNKPARSPCR